MTGSVALVGAGPGDPGLLTVKAARLIAEADILIYDALVSAPIVALASPQCELVYVGKRARNHTLPQGEISTLLVDRAREGKRVVRLKGGDPLVFGRGGEEAQQLRAAGVPYEIVPGISSALAAPAYAGIPVTHRDINTSFTVATGHEDPTKTASTLDWSRLADGHGMAIFLMAMSNLENVVAQLIRHGKPATTPVAIIRDGTTPRQVTIVGTLATIVADAALAGIGAPAIVAVGEGVRLREEIRWFDAHGLFGKRVLITRPQAERDDFVRRLWESGAEPVVVASIAYAVAPDAHACDLAVRALSSGAYAWVVLTSRYGVETLFAALREAGYDARAFAGTRVAVVGEKTAQALRENGIQADLVPDVFTASAVASSLVALSVDGSKLKILGWSAEGASDVLMRELSAAGHSFDVVAAYATRHTLAPELAEAAASCDIWTFASASAIDGFLAAVPDARELRAGKCVACLGPVTSAAARERGLEPDVVAAQATSEALFAALYALPLKDSQASFVS